MTVKTPDAYLHGDVVIVPVRIAHMLANRGNLEDLRIFARGVDPELYNVLAALHRGALQWRTSATGSDDAVKPEVDRDLKWLSTTEAAELLNMTDRGIRDAITKGRLKATTVAGRHRISRTDFEHYRAARRTT
jgi:excisionase family DNA binding protein